MRDQGKRNERDIKEMRETVGRHVHFWYLLGHLYILFDTQW